MAMDGTIDYDYQHTDLGKRLDEERELYNRSKRQYYAAAITDLASNLLTLAGYNKGARVSLATNSDVAKHQDAYEMARKRYNRALKDYEAKIADVYLRQKLNKGAGVGRKPLKHQEATLPVVGNLLRKRQASPLLPGARQNRSAKGTLEKAVRNFKTNY